MSIKLLGGIAKGFVLKVPCSDSLRPTAVLLKRRLFDSFQNLEDIRFIELCSGTGSIGLEAASRGSREVYLIESSRLFARYLQENVINFLKRAEKNQILKTQMQICQKWLKKNTNLWQETDNVVVFLDPPYSNKSVYEDVLSILFERELFKGQLWLESCEKKGLSKAELDTMIQDKHLQITKNFQQGSRYIAIIKRK